eukprot:1155043-Pelagomonas_calceolata.AAC.1
MPYSEPIISLDLLKMEAAQQQHADLCKNTSGKAVTLHTILLGVGRTFTLSIPSNSLNCWDLTTNVPLNLLANFMPILLRMPTSLLLLGKLKIVTLLTASFAVEGAHGSSEPLCLLSLN